MNDKITIVFGEEDNLEISFKEKQYNIDSEETIRFNVGGVELQLDSKTGVLRLLDNVGKVLSEVDFPTEKIITNAYYDYDNQELVLEYENAQAVRVPIKTDFSNYYTIDETNAIINNIKLEFNNGLNLKANKQDVYNKQIVEEKLSLKEDKTNLGNLAYKDSLNKTDIGLGNVLNVESYSKQETYSKTEIDNINSKKVDKIQGKGLSTNDLTNELLSKLNSLENYNDTNIKKQIDDIKQVLSSDDVDYDTLQELVNALKNNVSSIGDIFSQLSKKVDKIDGKQLSTNDYTTSEKNKLANLNNYDDTEIKQDIVDLENNKANKNELFSGSYNDLSDKPTIPSKISDLINDREFVTNTTNNLVNYYSKIEVYTKNEVLSLIDKISTMSMLVVDTLPTENISSTTIYLVPTITSENQNVYEEYIYVNNTWELIGNTKVDLTGLVREEQVMDIVEENSEEVETLNIATSTNYDVESDEQIPTTKAVKNIVDNSAPTKNFTGTYAEYEIALSNGLIPVGMIVYILDDDVIDEPVIPDSPDFDDRTSSLLGTGVLGYMILG